MPCENSPSSPISWTINWARYDHNLFSKTKNICILFFVNFDSKSYFDIPKLPKIEVSLFFQTLDCQLHLQNLSMQEMMKAIARDLMKSTLVNLIFHHERYHQRWRKHGAIYCLHCVHCLQCLHCSYFSKCFTLLKQQHVWPYILLCEVRTPLQEWADGLLSKMLEWSGLGDTPQSVMNTRAPVVLTNRNGLLYY